MIHIAVISHGHEELLISSKMGGLLHEQTNTQKSLASNETSKLTLWVKDNQPSTTLQQFCSDNAIFYTKQNPGLGFGENNNYLFDLIKKEVGFSEHDFFVVMNPDITITPQTLYSMLDQMTASAHLMATLNLYRDENKNIYDSNIRCFPSVWSLLALPFTHSFTKIIDKNLIAKSGQLAVEVDWASGAFLVCKPSHYEKLSGFSSDYFMYFEDVDICYRSKKLHNESVYYYPHFKATHAAAHKNRNLFSRHAVWFFQSLLTFLTKRYIKYGALPTNKVPLKNGN